MISRVIFALVSAESVAQSRTSVASLPPSNVEGHVCLGCTTARLDGVPWCEGFVFVTSRRPPSSERLPVP